MRLFLAIIPPKEIRDLVRDDLRIIKKRLNRNLNYIPVDQLHLTVKFLGDDVSEFSFNQIADELIRHQTDFVPCNIKLEDFNFGFHFETNPRILKYDIERTNDLDDMINTSHELMKKTGLSDVVRFKQKIDYHITAARLRNTASKKVIKDLRSLIQDINKSRKLGFTFKASEFHIMQSQTTKTDVIYKDLFKIEMKGKSF